LILSQGLMIFPIFPKVLIHVFLLHSNSLLTIPSSKVLSGSASEPSPDQHHGSSRPAQPLTSGAGISILFWEKGWCPGTLGEELHPAP